MGTVGDRTLLSLLGPLRDFLGFLHFHGVAAVELGPILRPAGENGASRLGGETRLRDRELAYEIPVAVAIDVLQATLALLERRLAALGAAFGAFRRVGRRADLGGLGGVG